MPFPFKCKDTQFKTKSDEIDTPFRDWSKSTGGGGGGKAEGGWVSMFSACPVGWVMLF